MRKKSLLLLLLMAMFAPLAANAQTVTIGTGTSAHNSAPIANYYNYSLAEMLFTSAEIGTTDVNTILSLGFEGAAASSKTYGITVYMKNVDATSFTAANDYIQVAESDVVYTGSIKPESGWNTIDLAEPFAYDNTKSLLVVVNKTSGGYDGSTSIWKYTSTSSPYMMLYAQNDGSSYNPTTLTSLAINAERPNVQLTFGTPPSCTAPTSVTATLDGNITWEGEGTTWNLNYKASSASTWTEVNGITSMSYTIPNLANLTTYSVRVQNVCDDNSTTAWTYADDFTTLAGIPLNEAFGAGSIPTGWAMYTGLLSNVMSGTALSTATYGWSFGSGNGVFDSHARVNIYGNSCNRWLVLPTLVMEDNVQLTFDLALTKYSGTLQEIDKTLGEDDRFVVLITTDGGTTWEILREWNNTGSEYVYNDIVCSAIGEAVAIDLSSYAGQSIAVAFYGESTVAETGSDNNLHIDNVSIDYIPACAKPTGLAVTQNSVTAHEATITWTSDAGAWQVQLNDEDPIDVEEATYTFTELAPETTYTAKVRANCDGTYSDWTNAVNFTTAIACPVPTSFATSNVGAHSVTLNWTSEASEWVVAYKTSAEEEFTEVTVTEIPYVLEGLTAETAYTVKVKAVCGGIDGESQYTSTRSFTTTVACPAPSNLEVSNLTATGATLTWTELGDGTAWYICLNGDEENLIETNETTYTFDGLESEMVYTAKVKSDCSAEDVWSSTVSFEPTAKLVIGSGTATFGYLPTNTNYDFSFTQQIYTVEELGEAGMFMSIDFYMTGTTDYTRNLDVYMVSTEKNSFTSNTDWIAVTAADMVFSGEVAFTAGAWTTIMLSTPFVYDGTQNVAIIVDDNTDVWSSRSFRTFTAQATQAHYCYQDDTNIDPSSPSASNNSTTNSKNQIRILKEALSSCMKPGNLTCTEFGPDFATLSWTEYGESTEWVVVYNGNNVTATTNEGFVLSGLDNETEYTIYVYPTCDETLASDPITVTTLEGCPAPQNVTVNPSYTTATLTWDGYNDSYNVYLGQANYLVNANFETGDFSQAGFTNNATYPWTVVANDHSGAYCAKSATGNNSQTSDLQLEVELTTDLTLTFSAKVSSESGYDKAYFSIDDEVEINGISGAGNWIDYSYPLTAGTHTLRWYYTKDSSVASNDDCFYVDDIQIVNGSTEIGTYTTTETSYDFTELTPGTTYQAKVLGFCDRIESDWSEIVTFTTLNYPTFTKTITAVGEENWLEGKGGYYLIASPLANALDPTTITDMTTGDYDLYSFDQEQDLEWQNYKAEAFNLVNGQGYLYANKEGVVLTFTGAPGNNGQVTLDLKGSGDWAGWNLVGNPFGEDAYINKPFYTLENSDTYTQNTVGTAIHAMQGLLVIADSDGETLTFSTEVPAGNKTAKLNMNLRKDDKQLDNAILVFGENQQLGKLSFRENSSKIYMPVEGKDYAIATAESNMGEMPVSFKAENNGSYTLSFTAEEVSFAYLHLIDNMTGIETDLLANPSYSFEARTTDYANRFKLVFATGNADDDFAFFSNGNFVINNEGIATVQVIDVNGRIISSESINGCANVNVKAAAGVYMIRLVNGSNVKVQKVVVK